MLKLLLTDQSVLDFIANQEKDSIPTEEWPYYLRMLKQNPFMIQAKIKRKLPEIIKLASIKLEREIIVDDPENDPEIIVRYFQEKYLPKQEISKEGRRALNAFFFGEGCHPGW